MVDFYFSFKIKNIITLKKVLNTKVRKVKKKGNVEKNRTVKSNDVINRASTETKT